MDYVTIGSSPADESCASLGTDGYAPRVRRECQALIRQLIRTHGEPPPNAYFSVVGFPHDFGVYFEVVCFFDPADAEAMAYAYRCEDGLPKRWDAAAQAEINGHAKKGDTP